MRRLTPAILAAAAIWAGAAPAAEARKPADDALAVLDGQALFEKIWIAAPSSTRASDGLGPYYNARACSACHAGGGRGRPPAEGETPVSFVVMTALPPQAAALRPEPTYGRQIQTFATPGLPAEARVRVNWATSRETLADGTVVELRRPEIDLGKLVHGPLAAGTLLSPRVAPPVFGLGLIEAIPAAALLARADPDDADGDGISGRANLAAYTDGETLGRFGWKAATADLGEAAARAFAIDIGLSNPSHPAPWGDCTSAEAACRTAPHGDGDARGFEIGEAAIEAVSAFLRHVDPPARSPVDEPMVEAGEALFQAAGCAACHTPTHVLPDGTAITPYSDLILHDMGPGLADGFSEGRATGAEWRTAPLWGIGLIMSRPQPNFLHDGRARNLIEAILWHGGEAEAARDAVAEMSAPDRAALIRFLETL